MRSLLTLVFVSFLLSATGCAVVTKDWHTENIFAPPWIAPNNQVIWQMRESRYPFLVVPPVWEFRMVDPTGKPVDTQWLASIANALRDSPMWEQWPQIPADRPHAGMRDAPFQFALVSLRPTVVLVWPSNRSDADDTARWYAPHLWHAGTWCDPLIPGLLQQVYCAAAIPRAKQLFWFSPDLDQMQNGFREVEPLDATHTRIVLPDDELLLEKSETGWQVSRVKRAK